MSQDLVFTKIASQSDTPPSGTASIYTKTDGKFYTMDDAGVESSLTGPAGPTGAAGPGVAAGGTTGQFLVKNSATNYDTTWANQLGPKQVSLTGTSTLGSSDQSVEVNSAANCTITLPAANSMITTVGANQYASVIRLFNTGTTVVTVAANGTDTIDGASTTKLQFQWSSITLYPNFAGTGWMIV